MNFTISLPGASAELKLEIELAMWDAFRREGSPLPGTFITLDKIEDVTERPALAPDRDHVLHGLQAHIADRAADVTPYRPVLNCVPTSAATHAVLASVMPSVTLPWPLPALLTWAAAWAVYLGLRAPDAPAFVASLDDVAAAGRRAAQAIGAVGEASSLQMAPVDLVILFETVGVVLTAKGAQ